MIGENPALHPLVVVTGHDVIQEGERLQLAVGILRTLQNRSCHDFLLSIWLAIRLGV